MAVKVNGLKWVCILWILLHVHIPESKTQRTYMRACECERTKSGKCAYTLLMPLPQDAGLCAGSTQDDEVPCEEYTEDMQKMQLSMGNLTQAIEHLKQNLTAIDTSTSEQAAILSELHGAVEEHQKALQNLALGGGGDGSGGSGATNSKQLEEMVTQLQQHSQLLISMQKQLGTQVGLGIQVGELALQVDSIRSQQEHLNQQLLQLDNDISGVLSDFRGLPERLGLCAQRGLLVSGTESYLENTRISVSSDAGSNASASAARIDSTAWCSGMDQQCSWWTRLLHHSLQMAALGSYVSEEKTSASLSKCF